MVVTRTRSQAKKAPAKGKGEDDSDTEMEDVNRMDHLENLMEGALTEIRQMKRRINTLLEQNTALEQEVERLSNMSHVSKASEARIKSLEEQHKKDKKRIKALQNKELDQEAQALADDTVRPDQDDEFHAMRKALRKFSDLMSVTTVESREKLECPICCEELEMEKFSCSVCEHFICNDCLPRLLEHSGDTVPCPTCRKPCDADTFGQLQYTESERWDALLDIAKEWELSGSHARPESVDPVSEMSEDENARSASESFDNDSEASDEMEAMPEAPVTPPPRTERISYSDSSRKEKQALLARLARERKRKR